MREASEAAGSPDFYEKARDEAKRLLAEHKVEPLPDDVAEQIHAVVVRADEEVGVFE